jgi:hypothetical protein
MARKKTFKGVRKMTKTTAKNVTRRLKGLIPSQKATSKKKKTDAGVANSYRESLLAKQVEAGRSKRSVNPEMPQDPAHAAGHRRLSLRQSVRH